MKIKYIISITGVLIIELANIYLYITKEISTKGFFFLTMSMALMLGLIIYQHNKKQN
jgi:hypothetical protein